jgi:hypothetical protein
LALGGNKVSFPKHLEILKQHYLGFCMRLVRELKGLQVSIFKILFRTTFDKSDNEESSQDYHETSP